MFVRISNSYKEPVIARLISSRRLEGCLSRARSPTLNQARLGSSSATSPSRSSTSSILSHPLEPTLTSVTHPYRFHIATSWFGKPKTSEDRPTDNPPFPLESPVGQWREQMLNRNLGPTNLEKRRGRNWAENAGEDFFFVQEMRNGSGISFGIADGVGGWVDSGVDPSLFSQSLMYHAHRYSENAWAGEPEIDPMLEYEEREEVEGWELTPEHCLGLALGGVLREKQVQAGSSTACMLTLNSSSGLLRSANLGDSGYSVIRSSNVIYREKVQTHFFNCPKQLTKLPANPGRKFSRMCVDSPEEANTHSMRLRDGDIVIAYTDGFSDNVFPADMLSICSWTLSHGQRTNASEDEQVQTMADNMVLFARDCMGDTAKVSPFEVEARREGMFFRGGKMDDVTVVVALVREIS